MQPVLENQDRFFFGHWSFAARHFAALSLGHLLRVILLRCHWVILLRCHWSFAARHFAALSLGHFAARHFASLSFRCAVILLRCHFAALPLSFVLRPSSFVLCLSSFVFRPLSISQLSTFTSAKSN